LLNFLTTYSQSTLPNVILKHGALPSILFEDLHEANRTPRGKFNLATWVGMCS
jgi:hypothetical protein